MIPNFDSGFFLEKILLNSGEILPLSIQGLCRFRGFVLSRTEGAFEGN
ncbi:MAG: hypothetical protein HKN00_03945 [Flavobacteriaceae bacterium]|nr:hypothetical protein [Flavobacteriaceae bacterium]